MFYRFECLLKNKYRNTDYEKWDGIFDYMYGDTLSLWCGLRAPKWYAKHPGTPSRAWFTDAGYRKWGALMIRCVAILLEQYADENFSVRMIVSPSLGKCGVKGKIQCVEELDSWDEYFSPADDENIKHLWRSAYANRIAEARDTRLLADCA